MGTKKQNKRKKRSGRANAESQVATPNDAYMASLSSYMDRGNYGLFRRAILNKPEGLTNAQTTQIEQFRSRIILQPQHLGVYLGATLIVILVGLLTLTY
jgi:hypothetical protein